MKQPMWPTVQFLITGSCSDRCMRKNFKNSCLGRCMLGIAYRMLFKPSHAERIAIKNPLHAGVRAGDVKVASCCVVNEQDDA